jgi:hypothetical protein
MSDKPDTEESSLALQLASAALNVVNTALESEYDHDPFVDASTGTYDVDCSGFISYLLGLVAPRHLAEISVPSGETRLLAHDYYTFFDMLVQEPAAGWLPIARLADAQPGDLVAWKLTDTVIPGKDTGHVLVVADTPTSGADSAVAVSVYDSSDIRHDDDSRGPGRLIATGVGSGVIHFQIGLSGEPTEFQFASGEAFTQAPIAIARIQGFSVS